MRRRYESGTVQTNLVSNAYRSDSGDLTALVNASANGQKTFSTATDETGTFTSLQITSERRLRSAN